MATDDTLSEPSRWLRVHRPWVLGAIVILSIVTRVVYFVQIQDGPCAVQHHWTETDMSFFDGWARGIVEGDVWTDRALHPYHDWHRQIAASQLGTQQGEAAGRQLWEDWLGGKRFYQEPLYPYALAASYHVFGPDVRWVFVWQALLGVLVNLLIYLVTARAFGETAALAAAALALLCGPLLFYDMVLLRATPISFAGLAVVWLFQRATDRGRWTAWLATGLALGLAMLLKSIFLPLALGLAGLAVHGQRHDRAQLRRTLGALVCGIAIGLTPLVVRNLVVGVPPLALSGGNVITFVLANTEDYRPESGVFVSMRHVPELMQRSGGRLVPAVAGTLATHDGPASYLRLLGGKLAAIGHWYEIPNNVNFYYYQLHASVLRALPLGFLVIGPLALAGMLLAVPRLRDGAPLLMLVASHIAALLAAFVLSRYRVPLMAALLPFAGLTVVRIFEASQRRAASAAVLAAGIALAALYVARPLPPDKHPVRPVDHGAAFHLFYDPLSSQARSREDWPRVAELLADALRLEPAGTRGSLVLAPMYARAHLRYAEALHNTGRASEAALHERLGLALIDSVGGRSSATPPR